MLFDSHSLAFPWWLAGAAIVLCLTLYPCAGKASTPKAPSPAVEQAKPDPQAPLKLPHQSTQHLPPLLSGDDAHKLLHSPAAQHIQWLYTGDSSLKPPLDRAQAINWQAFVHTDKEGVAWRLDELAKVKEKLGKDYKLSPKRPVVIFGDSITKFLLVSSGWGEEGRIAWMLEEAGFQHVSVVDGGYKAIVAHAPSHTLAGQFRQGPEAKAEKSVTFTELAKRYRKDPDSMVILDTRSWDEYRGLTSYVGIKGRIPGAQHFHVNDFFADDGRILPLAQLSQMLYSKGIDGKKPIVTYCSGGVRSAMAYYILRYHLGFPEVANYDGSWAEWSIKGANPL